MTSVVELDPVILLKELLILFLSAIPKVTITMHPLRRLPIWSSCIFRRPSKPLSGLTVAVAGCGRGGRGGPAADQHLPQQLWPAKESSEAERAAPVLVGIGIVARPRG